MATPQKTRRVGQLAVVSLLAACAGTQEAPVGEVELIAYDGEVASQSLGHAVVDFPWELQNPTSTKAGVGSVSWSFALDGGEPDTGRSEIGAEAAAGGSATGQVRVEVTTATTEAAFAARAKKVALAYEMNAQFAVKSGRGDETIEAQWYGEIFPPRKPEVTIKAEAGRYGDSNFELNFEISIANPNPFPVTVDGLDYVLTVKDVEISKDLLARGQQINPSSAFVFDVQRFIGKDDLVDLAKSLRGLKTIPYALAGKLTVGDVVMNTPVAGEIAFSH